MGQVPSLVYLHQIELNFSYVIDIIFAKSVQCPLEGAILVPEKKFNFFWAPIQKAPE